MANSKTEKAIFAAGCFWGVQDAFDRLKGVVATTVGYTGGHMKNPTYEMVCSHTTAHAEAVEVEFDPKKITYAKLVEFFFSMHDPTTKNRQGPDIGDNYRSAIFYLNEGQKKTAEKILAALDSSKKFRSKIVTEISPAREFYAAEEYHQKYFKKTGQSSCHI